VDAQARAATKADVSEIVRLYRQYREGLAPERGGGVHMLKETIGEPLEVAFDSLLQDDSWLLLIGTLDVVPLGISAARIEEMPDSSLLAAVDFLYVDPPAREVGVGEALLDQIVLWAGERGAAGVDVRVLPGMRESKNFLEGAGFSARLLVMHRRLTR